MDPKTHLPVTESYHVRVTKDHLVFSAGHFVTIGDFCERLHGHNWRVAAEVHGVLDENAFVVDFIALRDELQAIVQELDHHMLLPTKHPEIEVSAGVVEVEVHFDGRRWVFPADDCVLLPLRQTSAELLAQWIGERLMRAFTERGITGWNRLAIEVEENFGQSAVSVRERGERP